MSVSAKVLTEARATGSFKGAMSDWTGNKPFDIRRYPAMPAPVVVC